jgi:D-alanine-D-alanine ligase
MGGTREEGIGIPVLTIGFVYDDPPLDSTDLDDVSVEYEDRETLEWLRNTLSSAGQVVDIPWSHKAVVRLAEVRPDVVFNITEASGSRNRESLVPAVAESLGLAYTGSDAVGLGISLDKSLTKKIAESYGISTPASALVMPGDRPCAIAAAARDLNYPLIVKPNTGGSSMGIRNDSRVSDEKELIEVTCKELEQFGEAMLIEEFISGREAVSGLLDRSGLIDLPSAEIVLTDDGTFYSIERKSRHAKKVICPAALPDGVEQRINADARVIFRALGCQDLARVDYRIDDNGVPYFLEINPLPGLSPFYSIYPSQARAAGITPEELILQLVKNALERSKKGGIPV